MITPHPYNLTLEQAAHVVARRSFAAPTSKWALTPLATQRQTISTGQSRRGYDDIPRDTPTKAPRKTFATPGKIQ